ncbi:positive regulator of sigma(E), RseC/MucC [Oceanospirillum multiglobuliferum]|uniref:Uncharacterized protein n=1 Tax=Oceanospirillum multiglobuliferum TaxID=64969 RepID=A0A1T4KL96_9GAMM|nr:SoxR reducing system RseC family protein [Oceanospirillum multiglobuliferum]OPX56068.1 hypothetical protein BTE48_05845 [Oceanospirillum multiglobuliferum]SJZ43176.1 positive regulator of sigma(E), RseC/MucC [Oceanospirillum multiglobuliferum]
MLEEQALVVDKDSQGVWVETCRQSACQSCASKSSCGHSLLGKMSRGQTQRMLVKTHLDLEVGDQVMLGLSESAFLKGSALVYLLPLIAMIIMAIVGEQLFGADSWQSLALAASGLLIGFLFVRSYSKQHQLDPNYQPVVLRKLVVPNASVQKIPLSTL